MIDLLFTNKPERVIRTFNLMTWLSDHNLTLVLRKLSQKRLQYCCISVRKVTQKVIRKNDFPLIEDESSNINWSPVLEMQNPNAGCNLLTNSVTQVIQKHTKPIKCRRKHQAIPWMNKNICQLMKQRDLALKKSIQTKLITDNAISKSQE